MDIPPIAIMIIIALFFFGGRFVQMSGLRQLPGEEQRRVFNMTSKYRLYSLALLPVIALVFFALKNEWFPPQPMYILTGAIVLLGMLFSASKLYSELVAGGVSDNYLSKYKLSTALRLVSVAGLIFYLILLA